MKWIFRIITHVYTQNEIYYFIKYIYENLPRTALLVIHSSVKNIVHHNSWLTWVYQNKWRFWNANIWRNQYLESSVFKITPNHKYISIFMESLKAWPNLQLLLDTIWIEAWMNSDMNNVSYHSWIWHSNIQSPGLHCKKPNPKDANFWTFVFLLNEKKHNSLNSHIEKKTQKIKFQRFSSL